MLDDDLATVREPAAWLLAEYTGSERFERRYAVETDPRVRASLLVAVAEADGPRGAVLARSALGDAEPAVRAGAAVALAWAGQRLPEDSVAAVAVAFDAGDPLDGWSWANDTVAVLLARLVEPAALYAALARSSHSDIRMSVAYSIVDAIGGGEGSASLVPLLGPLLTDPDRRVRLAGVHAAADAGPAAVAVADPLVAVVEPITRGDGADLDDARNALHVLIGIDDPRWRPLLVAAWGHGSAHDDAADVVRRVNVRPDPDLLAAAIARIEALDGGTPMGRSRFQRAASPARERASLARLLASWAEAE